MGREVDVPVYQRQDVGAGSDQHLNQRFISAVPLRQEFERSSVVRPVVQDCELAQPFNDAKKRFPHLLFAAYCVRPERKELLVAAGDNVHSD